MSGAGLTIDPSQTLATTYATEREHFSQGSDTAWNLDISLLFYLFIFSCVCMYMLCEHVVPNNRYLHFSTLIFKAIYAYVSSKLQHVLRYNVSLFVEGYRLR